MNTKRMRVRGLLDCAGTWGTLNVGEEKEIEVNIAESLILGGLAEEVLPAGGEIVIERGDGIDANEASAAGAVLQQYAEQMQEQEQAPAPEPVAEQPAEPAQADEEREKKEEHPRRRSRKS